MHKDNKSLKNARYRSIRRFIYHTKAKWEREAEILSFEVYAPGYTANDTEDSKLESVWLREFSDTPDTDEFTNARQADRYFTSIDKRSTT